LGHSDAQGAGLFWVSPSDCSQGGDPNNGGYEAVASVSANANGAVYTVNAPPWGPTYEIHLMTGGSNYSKLASIPNISGVLMTLDATNVYWLDPTAGTLSKAPLSGSGSVTQLTSIGGAGGITVDSTYVYWGDASSVRRIHLTGGSADTLVSGIGSPGFLSVDATNLYYTAVSAALYRLPLGTTTPTELLPSQGTFKYPAIGPKTFYWSTGTVIHAVALTGGAWGTSTASPIRTLYTAPSGDTLVGLGVVGNSLYFVDFGNSGPINLMKLTPN
jgi:hypothetical protein